MMRQRHFLRTLLCLTVGAFFLSGCGSNQPSTENDEFFKHWKDKAKTSQAKSPSSGRNSQQPISGNAKAKAPAQKEFAVQRELPDIEFNMVVSNADLVPILRSMARSAGINIMINENIKGKVSLNLQKARWDDVFLSVLSTQGLTYVWKGDILVILTKEEYEQHRKLEPLEIKLVQINYADPNSLKDNLIRFLRKSAIESSGNASGPVSLLGGNSSKSSSVSSSSRGEIIVDPHTNSLMIQAVKSDMDRLLPLIKKLDRPPKQIRIEAHIVEANRDTAEELGVYWNGRKHNTKDGDATTWINSTVGAGGEGQEITSSANAAYALTGQWDKLGKSTLEVQLSALESEGKINILSSPSITTVDNRKATIESGREIPYQTESDGEVSIEYKKAVISLEVVPHVIDANTVKMVIKTNKDEIDDSVTVGGEYGNPGVITKKANTEVILFDGETTVIGGLQKEKSSYKESGLPLFMDIPIIGWLFRNSSDEMTNEEMLIFITPHILKEEGTEPETTTAPAQRKPSQAKKVTLRQATTEQPSQPTSRVN